MTVFLAAMVVLLLLWIPIDVVDFWITARILGLRLRGVHRMFAAAAGTRILFSVTCAVAFAFGGIPAILTVGSLVGPLALLGGAYLSSTGPFWRVALASLLWGLPSLVAVVPFVILLRLLVAQAFILPTGAMADTFRGSHIAVDCPDCGTKFAVNASGQVDPPPGRPARAVEGCICPNCRRRIDFDTPRPATEGDRVLVLTGLADSLHGPTARFDVTAFRYPPDPSVIYLKRLVGMPGEMVAIADGDVYAAPTPPELAVSAGPDAWKPESLHPDDPAALTLFAESRERAVRGESRPGDFVLVRKPPAVWDELKYPVWDDDARSGRPGFVPPWSPDEPNAWRIAEAAPRSYRFIPTGNAPKWLRFRRPVTDFVAYNSEREYDRRMPAGDLILDAEVSALEESGEVLFELAGRGGQSRARFNLTTGECVLTRHAGAGQPAEVGRTTTPVRGPGVWRVRFADVDGRLTVRVGAAMVFGDGVEYAPAEEGQPPDEPAAVGAAGAEVRFGGVKLWRDLYWTNTGGKDGVQTWVVPEGHYFALGDNSAASADSRYWGAVPASALFGRAVAIYHPPGRMRILRP